jgi:hypothetical protein
MKTLLVPSQLVRFSRKKDGSVSYTFESTIEISNKDFSLTDKYYQQTGYMAFKLNEFTDDDIPDTNAEKRQGEISPSTHLRNRLFAKHMNTGGSKDTFPEYYRKAIEGFANAVDNSY